MDNTWKDAQHHWSSRKCKCKSEWSNHANKWLKLKMTGNIKSCQHKFGEAGTAVVYGATTLKHRLFLTKIIPYCHITQYCHSYSLIQGKLKYISRNGLVLIVLLATLFTMAKNGKNPNTHQQEWANKLWHFLTRKWNTDTHENSKKYSKPLYWVKRRQI